MNRSCSSFPFPTGKTFSPSFQHFFWYPCLKMSTTQKTCLDGGLSVPNFKLYFGAFVIPPVVSCSSYFCLFTPPCTQHCTIIGPIIFHTVQIWHLCESLHLSFLANNIPTLTCFKIMVCQLVVDLHADVKRKVCVHFKGSEVPSTHDHFLFYINRLYQI